jgi:hypothetical protein
MSAWPRARAGVIATAVLACACSSPWDGGDLWNRPAQSGVRDAHAVVTGTSDGATFAGEGVVVFRPRLALSLHLQTRSAGVPAELHVLQVGGATYQRAGADERWTRTVASPPDPTWSNATDPQLVGQERLAGDVAWHLRALRGDLPVEMWVRQRDGFPLRLTATSRSGSTFTFAFDRFNTGAGVSAPAAIELKPAPRNLRGQVGDTLALNAARLTVLSVETDAEPEPSEDVAGPRPGNRFVVVEVEVENVAGGPLSTFFDWRLSDGGGFAWDEAMAIRQPAIAGDELRPGDSVRGYLTYEVSRTASGLALTVRVDDDTATFTLG